MRSDNNFIPHKNISENNTDGFKISNGVEKYRKARFPSYLHVTDFMRDNVASGESLISDDRTTANRVAHSCHRCVTCKQRSVTLIHLSEIL